MSKKLLISTVAALALSSAAMAATSKSWIANQNAGQVFPYEAFAIGVQPDENMTASIIYHNAPKFGKDDTITFTIENGKWDTSVDKSKIILINEDDNTSYAQADDWGDNYVRVKVTADDGIPGDLNLTLADADTNSSDQLLITPKSTACNTKIKINVTKALNSTGQAINVALATMNDDNATTIAAIYHVTNENNSSCPKTECYIVLPEETQLSANAEVADGTSCPTCSDQNKPSLTCGINWTINKDNTAVEWTAANYSNLKVTLDATEGSFAPVVAVEDTGYTLNTNYKSSIATDKKSATIDYINVDHIANTYNTTVTVDGKQVLEPSTFAATFSLYNPDNAKTVTLGKAPEFMQWVSQGATLYIPYVNGLASYRTFVRISVTGGAAEAPIVATVMGEKGDKVTFTLDGVKAPKDGAVIVEGTDLLSQAKEAGYTGTDRMNVELKVKTTGDVDAVAYMTDAGHNGSQRKLPVAIGNKIW